MSDDPRFRLIGRQLDHGLRDRCGAASVSSTGGMLDLWLRRKGTLPSGSRPGTRRSFRLGWVLLGGMLLNSGIIDVAPAQNLPVVTQATQTIKRTPLQRFDIPGTNYETVIGIAEIVPNVSIGRHTHPGPESGYLLEGEFTLLVDGDEPVPLKAGQSYRVPPGAIHDARTGAAGAKVIATYIIEKGKPIASPAQ